MPDSEFLLQFKVVGMSEVVNGINTLNQGLNGVKNTITGFAAGATGFLVVDEAIQGLRKGFELLGDAIKHAAGEEESSFSLKKLIGDADLAEQKLKELVAFKEQAGIFSFQELAEGAKALLLIGTGTENLIPRLRSMAEISAVTGERVDAVVAAYQRLRFAIERGTEPMIRGMGGMSTSVITLIRALQDETGKTEAEVLKMFKEHTVSIELLNKALADATTGTGRYANAITEKAQTMRGAIAAILNTWGALQNALGAPIRDAVTPLLTQFREKLEELRPFFSEIGQRIAGLVRDLAKIGEDLGWRTVLLGAWEVALREMARLAAEILLDAFVKLGPAAAKAFAAGFVSDLKGILHGQIVDVVTGAAAAKGVSDSLLNSLFPQSGINEARNRLQDALHKAIAPLQLSQGPGFNIVDVLDRGALKETKDIATAFQGEADSAKKAAAEIAAAREKLTNIEGDYRLELEKVKALEESGAIDVQQGDALKRNAAQQYLASLQKIRSELVALQKTQVPGSKEWEEVRRAIIQTDIAYVHGIQDMSNATFFGKIRSQIVQLKNEWADLGKQLGTFITQQAQAFASTMGNAIGSLIFRTGNLKDAILQLGQAFVSQLATMVIQYVLSQTILKGLAAAFGAESSATAAAQAAPINAAFAPAAINASIATFGAAADLGIAQYLAAFAAGLGISQASGFLGGGAQSGGYTGDGSDTDVAGFHHRGEFIFSAPRVRALGRGMLEALHSGFSLTRPIYSQGGGAATAGVSLGKSAAPNVGVFFDKRDLVKWMRSRDGRKTVYDAMNRRHYDL